MKESLCIWKRAQMFVEYCEQDHDHHRRQNEPDQRYECSTPAPQAQSDIGDGIAGARAGKALCERECFSEFGIREPATFSYCQRADLRQYGHAAAKTYQPDFEEG